MHGHGKNTDHTVSHEHNARLIFINKGTKEKYKSLVSLVTTYTPNQFSKGKSLKRVHN
jgi:hypothetical protein